MNSILRIAAVSALSLPLGACGTLWYGNDAFSSVESSRERARAKVAHFEAGHGLVAQPAKHGSARRADDGRVAGVRSASDKFVRGARSAADVRARRTDDARMAYAEEGRRAGSVPKATPERIDRSAIPSRVPEPEAAVRASRPAPAPAAEVRTAAIAPAVRDERRLDPSAVPPPAPTAAPRATATQIRDAIFRAWNGVMPTGISSMALFGVNPYPDGRFADRGSRITSPEAVIDRRTE